MTTYVLVHGAWHRGRHWDALAAELRGRGHEVLAVDLLDLGARAATPSGFPDAPDWPDRPSPVAGLTLDAVVDDLLAQVRDLPGPVVLVAHSMGGAVATRAAERAPHLLARVVYVAAFVPTTTGPAGAYLGTEEASTALGGGLYLGDPAATGAVRIDPARTDPAYREELARAYFTGLPAEHVARLVADLTPDQPLCFLTTETGATEDGWGSVPRTYVRTPRDQALPLALQDRMIAEGDRLAPATASTTVTIDAGHAVFASHPVELADALEA